MGGNYAFISSVASLPTMCMMAKRPPGCLSSHESSFRTESSKITIVLPWAIKPSTVRRDIISSRPMVDVRRVRRLDERDPERIKLMLANAVITIRIGIQYLEESEVVKASGGSTEACDRSVEQERGNK